MRGKIMLASLALLALAQFGVVPHSSAAPSLPATVRCVNPGGTGGCYASIQTAINDSNVGDRIDVAAGTYAEHITLLNGVSVYGEGWDYTIIDGGFSAALPTVSVPWYVSASTVLSGVQVTGGGTGTPTTSLNGGGLAIGGSPHIINTFVYSNTGYYGGGVYVSGGSPLFENVPAWDNEALFGGGFYLTGESVVTVIGNPLEGTNGTVFGNRAASDGGGMYIANATVTLAGLRFYSNWAAYNGGALYVTNASHPVTLLLNDITGNHAGTGGGLMAYNATQLNIALNLFGNPQWLWLTGPNTATYGGGGAMLQHVAGTVDTNWFFGNTTPSGDGGGLAVWGPSEGLQVTHNWFEGNSALSGGGLGLLFDAKPLIDANSFVTNTANVGAGVYAFQAGTARVVNNIIARNTLAGGGLAGGGVAVNSSPLRLINNTIAYNTGDGVFFSEAEGIVVVNNIIYANSDDGIEHYVYSTPTISYTSDYNDLYLNGYALRGLPPGIHDVALDPQFVNAGADVAARLHIQPTSPVATLGALTWAPARDYDREVRVYGGTVSIGADELPAAGYSTPLPFALRAP